MNIQKRTTGFDVAPRFFDSLWMRDINNTPAHALKNTAKLPAVNVLVNEEAYIVELLAPGLNKEQFNVELENEILTVSYKQEQKQQEESADGQSRYLLKEFNSYSFSRSFTFPKGVIDEEKISATYTDGILRLQLAKREEAKPKAPRNISVV
ncbi:heat shock protein Hsp20 [Flammeovirgaceae bacterium 311]|nr:heat shock protein Hsp20 [Flammeovirgaceae bacterium 311]